MRRCWRRPTPRSPWAAARPPRSTTPTWSSCAIRSPTCAACSRPRSAPCGSYARISPGRSFTMPPLYRSPRRALSARSRPRSSWARARSSSCSTRSARSPNRFHGKPLSPRPPLRRPRIPDRLGVLARARGRPVRRPRASRARRPGRRRPAEMRAMMLRAPGSPLQREARRPRPLAAGEVRIRVKACGVCRTDLHLVDGELPACSLPVIPGHEVVGAVMEGGERFAPGARVGVPWLGWTCGACEYCRNGRENLCERARFTGCHVDGGNADEMVADERFCLAIPERYDDAHAAPLLCAGLIGYRCYAKCEEAGSIGLYGFGAAAHILAQVARGDGRRVLAFT